MNNKFKIALDIGTTKIACIIGKINNEGKIEIHGTGIVESIGVKDGIINNIDKTVSSIKEAVRIASESSNVVVDEVIVGIAGNHIRSLTVNQQKLRENYKDEILVDEIINLKEELRNYAVAPGEEILHIIPSYYTIDNQNNIKDPVGMSGNKLIGFYHIVFGNQVSARNIVRCVERSGLKINNLVLEPIASSLVTLDEDEKDLGIMLLDIGGGTSDIIVFKDNSIIYTASIPLAGNSITSDISESLQITYKQAEEIKLKFGKAKPEVEDKNNFIKVSGMRGYEDKDLSIYSLSQIIEARVKDLLHAIYKKLHEENLINLVEKGGIILTGGGSLLQNLRHLIASELGFKAIVGLPDKYIKYGKDDTLKNPKFSTAFGLILSSEYLNNHDIDNNTESDDNDNETKKSPKRKSTNSLNGITFMAKIKKYLENETEN